MKIAVIGGGAAGSSAAFALKARGHTVSVFRSAPGATAVSSGCVDLVASEYYPHHTTLPRAYRAFLENHHDHILRVQGIPYEKIQAALLDWSRRLETAGLKFVADFENGLIVANVWGWPKWSVMVQKSQARGDLRGLRGKKIALAIFENSPMIHARSFLNNIAMTVGQVAEWLPVTIRFADAKQFFEPFQFARRLDQASVGEEFVRTVKKSLPAGAQALALPPVCGMHQVDAVLETLERATGIPCFELGATHDSVPGMRLFRAMERAMEAFQIQVYPSHVHHLHSDARGVTLEFSQAATTVSGEQGPREELSFDKVVFASGRYLGAGLRATDHGPIEPIAQRPVYLFPSNEEINAEPRLVHPDFPCTEQLWNPAFFKRHEGLNCGLSADGKFQIADHLYATGVVMGRSDPSREQAGLATAVTLGSLLGESL